MVKFLQISFRDLTLVKFSDVNYSFYSKSFAGYVNSRFVGSIPESVLFEMALVSRLSH